MARKADGDECSETVEEPVEELDGEFSLPEIFKYVGQYLKQGEVVNFHGSGRLVGFVDKCTFEGEFENGFYKHGKFTCPSAVYVGCFRNNVFHGTGTYSWSNCSCASYCNCDKKKYDGMWSGGVQHGWGRYDHFSRGVENTMVGFSIHGKFNSGQREQEAARIEYLNTYSTAYANSAVAVLRQLVETLSAGDVKKKPDEAIQVEMLKHLLVASRVDSAVARDEQTEDDIVDLVIGPFPSETSFKLSTLQSFLGPAAKAVVFETKEHYPQMSPRLQADQLQHIGQAVALSISPNADVQSSGGHAEGLIVLLNIARTYDVVDTHWKIVLYQPGQD